MFQKYQKAIENKILRNYTDSLNKLLNYEAKHQIGLAIDDDVKNKYLRTLTFYLLVFNVEASADKLGRFIEKNRNITEDDLINIFRFLVQKKTISPSSQALYNDLLEFISPEEIIKILSVMGFTSAIKTIALLCAKHKTISLQEVPALTEKCAKSEDVYKKLIAKYKESSRDLKNLFEKIRDFDKHPFYELPKFDTRLLDKETLCLIYLMIIEAQKDEFNSLSTSAAIGIHDKEKILELALNKFNLSLKSFKDNSKFLAFADSKKLEEILTCFKKSKIDISCFTAEDFQNILVFANLKDVQRIMILLDKKVVNPQFIYENPKIFFKKDNEFNDFFENPGLLTLIEENLALLSAINLNFDDYYDPNILLLDKDSLVKNLKIFRKYINKLGNQKLWCSLIKDPALFKIIDFFLENAINFENINFTNLKNVDIDLLIKKMYLALNCNIAIFKNGMIDLEIIAELNKENIDEFIPDETRTIIPIDILEEFKLTKVNGINDEVDGLINFREYRESIDGNAYFGDDIVVSKNKILRNLSIIINKNDKYSLEDLIFYAIIHNSFLSENEIKKIKGQIKKQK